jgi:inner membrane protein
MALTFAHSTAGYLLYEATRPAGPHRPVLLAAAVAFANGADLDFLPGIVVGHPAEWHRGVTHTALAAVAVAALVFVVVRLWGRPRRIAARSALFAGAAWASHVVIDFFTVDSQGHGAPYLWPFSSTRYGASRPLIGETVIDPSGVGPFLASLVTPHALGVWAHELVFLLGAVFVVHAVRVLIARAAPPVSSLPEGS